MQLELREDIQQAFNNQTTAFDEIMALKGKVFRSVAGRETLSFSLQKKTYFIKKHFYIGWKEFIKPLLKGQLPILGARNEWRVIRHLNQFGVNTLTIAGFGERGWNPISRQSFLITDALEHIKSVNDLMLEWKKNGVQFQLKKDLTIKIAKIMRAMHQSGVNHRDCYLLHFLISKEVGKTIFDISNEPIYLIDLHRAQIRKQVPERWLRKDLAGLYFSSKNITLTRHDLFRFMKYYRNDSLKNIFSSEKKFWERIQKQGEALFKKRAIQ